MSSLNFVCKKSIIVYIRKVGKVIVEESVLKDVSIDNERDAPVINKPLTKTRDLIEDIEANGTVR